MNSSDTEIASFGPFRLSPAMRAIEKDGVPLTLGHRALDILIVLVERAGEIVSHRELISRVWRGLVVNPSNLRVHMTGLRKALGDGDRNTRYIANVVGQGYCFVAPINRETARPLARAPEYPCGAARQRLVLPPLLARMVGREAAIRRIAADLIAERFVTIIGPGGMGKTTVAVSVAHAMLEEFGDAVCFVDIGAVSDPKLVAATIASTLGLTVQSEDVLPALMQCLQSVRVLLVLDNCEHVIDATAMLAEHIFKEVPGVHILATSREALRVEGEHAYLLQPLASPPPDVSLRAAEALTFPAVQLFMERAAASGSRFELRDADASIVAGICARLDGIALAIEFAAGRVGTHGIAATADLLNQHVGLNWQGRRTAIARHQTLRALLDWSYSTLAESERRVLRRLSIFVGTFTIAAAQAVAFDNAPDESYVINTVDCLVAKSLLSSVNAEDGRTRYRLLETTRSYASEKLEESGESQLVTHHHAKYFAFLLNRTGGGVVPAHAKRAPSLSEHLGNIRASLERCFADYEAVPGEPAKSHAFGSGSRVDRGRAIEVRDPVLAIELAAGSAPVFLELSLLNECHRWSAAALALLDDTTRGSALELVLQEARAISATWTLGNGDGVRAAITRALAIAHSLGQTEHRLRLLIGLHIFLIRVAELQDSLAVAEEVDRAARSATDTSFIVVSDWLLGSSHHFMGNQAVALRHFQSGFAYSRPLNMQLFGLDYRVGALATFNRVLWLSGFPDRAMEIAREAIAEAAKFSKPLNVCFSLLYTAPVFLWCGDLGAAHDVLGKLTAHPNWHALPSLHATTFALQGELFIRLGEAKRGVSLLRSALKTMRTERQHLLLTRAMCLLAEGLAAVGEYDEALSVIGSAVAESGESEETSELPERLRVRAEILLSMSEPNQLEAEDCLTRALSIAHRQSALAWELRAGMTLAQMRARQGRGDEAHQLLSSLYGRFTEGFETSDLKAASQLLKEFDDVTGSQSSCVRLHGFGLDGLRVVNHRDGI
jgi:predicted ATPase/DNA-binding winged helix-turn-helix (wHTH) protein